MKTGIEIIAEERQRQIEVEGWTPEHDLQHSDDELANAASTYAMSPGVRDVLIEMIPLCSVDKVPPTWPWDEKWYKPTPDNRIRELAKAGALIAAEIDRLNKVNELEENLEEE